MLYIFIVAAIIWSLRTLFFVTGIYKQRKVNRAPLVGELPFVSIIVPARDEEDNLESCLDAILANDYPKARYEILCINDCSTDSTEQILKRYSANNKNIRYKTLKDSDRPINLNGKPGALQAGFDLAKGQYVLMTDADCKVNPNWIRSIATTFKNENADMILGLTHLNYHGLFGRLQSIEWIYMSLLASGGIGWNTPIGCFGNNLSMSKKLIDETGGFRKLSFSLTEDLLLMQTAHKLGAKIRYMSLPEYSIVSEPTHDFKTYFKQHHRWALGGKKIGNFAGIFVMTSAVIWTSLLASIILMNPIYALLTLGIRMVGDLVILFQPLYEHKRMNLFLLYIPLGLFSLLLTELLAPFFLLKKTVEWKGRTFKI